MIMHYWSKSLIYLIKIKQTRTLNTDLKSNDDARAVLFDEIKVLKRRPVGSVSKITHSIKSYF